MLGYKIGLTNDDLYIAIPKKYFDKYEIVQAECDGIKQAYVSDDRVAEATQSDKFGKGLTYILYYFLWKKY